MKILGIDPGNIKSAAVLYDSDTHEILWKCKDTNENMMIEFDFLMENHKDVYPVIEQVKSYGMAVGETTFETVFWSGRFAQFFSSYMMWDRIPRLEIKKAICHNGGAKDANIRQALIDMFPATGGGKIPQIGIKSKPGPLYGFASD